MSVSKQVGSPVAIAGVPDGLHARSVDTIVTNDDGTRRVQTDRWRRNKLTEVALIADPPPLDVTEVVGRFGHRAVRIALATGARRRSGPKGAAPEPLGVALAQCGLVVLRCEVTTTASGLATGRWQRWERTPVGAQAAAAYAVTGPQASLASYAREQADTAAGGPQAWQAAFARAYERTQATVDRAVTLTRSGQATGWPLSRFALEVTGDTHGLDGSIGRLVQAGLADAFGVGDADSPAQVWADAGLGVDVLASNVVSVGLPAAGSGLAAVLLAGAAGDGLPVTVPRVRLVADPDPVAPPPSSGAVVFAVENEALVSWAWRTGLVSPVVWSSGTDAAARLLAACGRAGWTVAVSADFEPGGLARAASLLARVPGAVPWRLAADDYLDALGGGNGSGPRLSSRQVATPWDPQLAEAVAERRLRVTEEDRWDLLTDDMQAGRIGEGYGPVSQRPG